MANWTIKPQPFGANHTPLLEGLSSIDGLTPVPVAVDPATGSILTTGTATISGTVNSNITQVGGSAVTLGQKTMANSFPVAIASDQSAVPISAASLPLPTGAATAALQTQPGVDIGDVTINNTSGAGAVNIQDGGNSITVDGSVTASGSLTTNNAAPGATNVGALVAAAMAATPVLTEGNQVLLSTDLSARLRVQGTGATGSAVPGVAAYIAAANGSGNLTGLQTASAVADTNAGGTSLSSQVILYNGTNFSRAREAANATNSVGTGIAASGILAQLDDTSPTTITENQFGNLRMSSDRSLLVSNRATTPTQTSVASSASSVSLLAANNARKGAVITNDSSAVLYVKLGATASTTSYTYTLAGAAGAPFTSLEIPFGYVGAIDGIWASATGNARITEIT